MSLLLDTTDGVVLRDIIRLEDGSSLPRPTDRKLRFGDKVKVKVVSGKLAWLKKVKRNQKKEEKKEHKYDGDLQYVSDIAEKLDQGFNVRLVSLTELQTKKARVAERKGDGLLEW
jgi:hypothetical protein